MGANNILNANASDDINPDYNWIEQMPNPVAAFQPRKGPAYARQLGVQGYAFELGWEKRPLTTAAALRQWEAQYRLDYFTFRHFDLGRYFTGRFAGPLQFSPVANNRWNIKGTFVELPGKPMYAYPTNWARDAVFLDAYDSDQLARVKLSGSGWGAGGAWGAYRSGYGNQSAGADATFELIYYGYGFRFWSPLDPAASTAVKIYLDGTLLTTLNLTAGATTVSAALYEYDNASLDEHRVAVVNTVAATIFADAIQVMV